MDPYANVGRVHVRMAASECWVSVDGKRRIGNDAWMPQCNDGQRGKRRYVEMLMLEGESCLNANVEVNWGMREEGDGILDRAHVARKTTMRRTCGHGDMYGRETDTHAWGACRERARGACDWPVWEGRARALTKASVTIRLDGVWERSAIMGIAINETGMQCRGGLWWASVCGGLYKLGSRWCTLPPTKQCLHVRRPFFFATNRNNTNDNCTYASFQVCNVMQLRD